MGKFDRDNKLYARMFLFVVLSMVFTIFSVSTALYMNFESIGQTLLHSFIKDTLSQVSYSATLMTGTAKTMITQINTDSSVSRFFNPTPPDKLDYSTSFQRLSSYNNSFPFINSICVYNAYTQTFYTDASHINIYSREELPDKWAIEAIENPGLYGFLVPIPRKMISAYSEESDPTFVYSYILTRNKNTGSKNQNTIILNISEEWIKSIIQSMDVNPGSNTFIIDGKGLVVSTNDKYEVLSDIHDLEYIQDIIKSKEASNYFIKNIDGVKTLVTYVASNSTDWRFVRLTPYETIVSRIKSMKNTTLLIGCSILILGILVSLFLSRRIYSPIHKILSKLNSLEKESRKNLFPLKQEFMRGILQGEIEYSRESLHIKLDEFKINLDENSTIRLLFLKIDCYNDFCIKQDTNDRSLLRFAIMNVVTEIFSQKHTCEAVDMGEDHIILLFNSPSKTTHKYQQEIDDLIKSIQASIFQHLSISLSAVISLPGNGIGDASELYNMVMDASHYLLFYERQSIIYADAVLNKSSQEYVYPQNKEKLLINALVSSKDAEAKLVYTDIINGAKNCSYNTFYTILIRLAAAVNMTADSIEQNSGFPISFDFASFISQLQSLESIQDIDNHFYSMFDHILQKLEEKKNPKYDDLVRKIYNIIDKRYSDINMSRELIADEVGLSSVYLGRLFLKLTSQTIADYISNFRLQKARELLISTGSSVSDISTQVGFTSTNHFYALFKKATGVTPSEFRQNGLNN